MPELLVILCHSLCFYGKWPMHRNDLLKACLCPKEKAHNAPSFHMPCTVSSWHKIAGPSNIWEVSTLTPDDLLCGDHWRPRGHWHQGEEHWLSVYSTKYATFTHQVQLKWGLLYKDLDMVQCNNFQQVKTVIAIFLNASEDAWDGQHLMKPMVKRIWGRGLALPLNICFFQAIALYLRLNKTEILCL